MNSSSLQESTDLFADMFESCGGFVVEMDEVEGFFYARYSQRLKALRATSRAPPTLVRTHFQIVDNPALGAWAAWKENSYLIAISRGTFQSLSLLFRLLLSHPKFLPDVGDPSKEYASYDLFVGYGWTPGRGIQRQGALLQDWTRDWRSIQANLSKELGEEDIEPTDPLRSFEATKLRLCASDFLFYHELGHILRGHLTPGGEAKIYGVRPEFDRPPAFNERHDRALELDADEFAVNASYIDWRDVEVLQTWVVAAAWIFTMFDRSHSLERKDEYIEVDHPHPAMRLIHLATATFSVAGNSTRLKEALSLALPRATGSLAPFGINSFLGLTSGPEGKQMYETLLSDLEKALRQLTPMVAHAHETSGQ